MPLRRRLWQGGILLFAFLATLVIGNRFIPQDRAVPLDMLGRDFLPFYTAGTFAREGNFKALYDLDAVKQYEQAVAKVNGLELGESFGPWWNPPFYAWAFAPLSKLPFTQALATWWTINFLCLLGSIVLLIDMLPKAWKPVNRGAHSNWTETARDWRTTGLVLLLILTSMPALQAVSHGQNTCTSLLLVCLTITFWRKQKPLLAGLICGLLFYKPQLACVLAMVLVLSTGWRALVGVAFTGCMLLSVTEYSMPGIINTYLQQLPANIRFMQIENAYLWERHVTLKALFRMLLQGREAGEISLLVRMLTFAGSLLFAGYLLRAILAQRKRFDDPWTGETCSIRRDRLIAATICISPLLMPFYFDYDLLLLSVPAVLFAGDILTRAEERSSSEKWLTRTWGLMYLWLFFNPAIAGKINVNITTILLSIVASQMVLRAARKPARLSLEDIRTVLHAHPLERAAA
jgi:hypothetical protein